METSKRDTYLITGGFCKRNEACAGKRDEGAEKRETRRVRRYPCREELAGMSIANRHLYVNGLIVARASSRAERRSRQSGANETDRVSAGKIRDTAVAKREARNDEIKGSRLSLDSRLSLMFPFLPCLTISPFRCPFCCFARISYRGPRLPSSIVLSKRIFDGQSRGADETNNDTYTYLPPA